MLGDSVTTDHISPAGDIKPRTRRGDICSSLGVSQKRLQLLRRPPRQRRSDDARHLRQHPHQKRDGAGHRRLLAPPTFPRARQCAIYDAAMNYQAEGVGQLILAGKEYGTGSSRDWAAKGVALLGVKAVIAESFERIHRSNLVGMGVLPLEFVNGETRDSLGLPARSPSPSPALPLRPKAIRSPPSPPMENLPGEGPHRYPNGDPLLSQRRHPALRPAAVGGEVTLRRPRRPLTSSR
jgi:aconitate hydratase